MKSFNPKTYAPASEEQRRITQSVLNGQRRTRYEIARQSLGIVRVVHVDFRKQEGQ